MSVVGRSGRAVRLFGPVLLAASSLVAARASAQQGTQSATASVSVSLRVLPQASLEGVDQRVSGSVLPGDALRVDPSAGARARMTYSAPMQVEVSGTPLVGPGGVTVRVRYVCAFGGGTTVSAGEPFDCVGGLAAGLAGSRLGWLPLAVGAEVSARETLAVPPGVYVGRVTLTAASRAY